ncbi:hypothetical protein PYW08_016376 [Mythimna loreyi]|uniref:Uncharacterized protein n=1 Tax=Mythimna loreyi TaxID=667449 RepID=A0ACC2QX35_9NEOP|nr:hypothetical protein PYW08_016376 [Mythimna loreyi]
MIGRSPPKTTSSPSLHSSEPNLSSSSDTHDKVNQRKRKSGDAAELQRMEKAIMEMKNMFSELVSQRSQQNVKIDSLHTAIENIRSQNAMISTQNSEIRTQNDDIRASVQFLSDKYDDAMMELGHLKSECSNNKKIIKILELKVDHLEKNLKSASLELKNILSAHPETQQTLTNSVQKIGNIISQPVKSTDIKTIFRTKSKKDSVGTVLVEFTSSSIKEQFLNSSKNYNKLNKTNRLNTTLLQATGPEKPIYVSEALTTMTKRLHFLSREFIKSSTYEQCWIANGKVYVREKEGMPSRLIRTEEDLVKLRKEK